MYVGSHGLEIDGPMGEYVHPGVAETQQTLAHIDAQLAESVSGLGGIYLERQPFSIAVHTRNAESEQARTRAREAATEAVAGSGGQLVLQHGKEVAELRPAVDWNKGSAVAYLLDQLPRADHSGVLYFGDDRTDEDAVAWVESSSGVAVRVGRSADTVAAYRLAGPNEVIAFLARLSDYVCEEDD